jgi:hypothetical protein
MAQLTSPIDADRHGTIEILFVTPKGYLVFGADTLLTVTSPSITQRRAGEIHKIVNCGPGILCSIVGTISYNHSGPVIGGDATTAIEVHFNFPDWLPAYDKVVVSAGKTRLEIFCQAISDKAELLLPSLNILAKAGNLRPPDPNEKTFFSINVVGYESGRALPEMCQIRVNMDWKNGIASLVPFRLVSFSAGNSLFTGKCENALAAFDGTNPKILARYNQIFPLMIAASNVSSLKGEPEEIRVALARIAAYIQIEAEFNPDDVGGRVEVSLYSLR